MRCLTSLLPLLLSACAQGVAPNAPSLLPRAIESRSDAEPVAEPQPVLADPTLDGQIAARVAAFETTVRAFSAAEPTIDARIARAKGAAEGSERWLDGQSAIGDLQQARTAADGAMTDLEALAIDRASAGKLPYPTLDTAIAAAQAELNRQAAIERQMKAMLN